MALINAGMHEADRALAGFGQAASMEERRNNANKQLKQRAQTRHNESVGGMTATGAAIGTEVLPGWGTLIGAAAGFLYGELFM